MIHKLSRGRYMAAAFAVFATVLLVALPTPSASAATSCTWTTKTTVVCNGETFSNPKTSGNQVTLSGKTITNRGGIEGVPPTCTVTDKLVVTGQSGQLTLYPQTTNSGGSRFGSAQCPSSTTQVNLSNTAAAAGTTATTTASTTTTNGNCPSGQTTDANGNCTGNTDQSLTCGSGAMSWIICPVITLAVDGANRIDSFIMNSLDIDVSCIFDTTNPSANCAAGAAQGYYTAWNSFRIIATALLVIAGLVMVAAQAFGFEILDAYTIRKVLPRLLVAVIGISLSWPLMRIVVSFFDTVGIDLRQLMYTPFSHLGGTLSVSGGILSSAVVVGAVLAMGLTSLTLILTALLAVFVGFMIVIIRQIAVIMLIIVAPVAIACYILPNTQKIWKLWYDNFLGLMLMFPIISGLIAAGHIFAAVALKPNAASGQTGSVFAQATAIIAYFAPYFLLPMAARFATGAIGNIAGFVNDRHRGAFDRLKGARTNATQRNMAKMKTGNRFSERNMLTRGFNRTSVGVGTGWNGRFGMGARGKEAIDQTRRISAMNDVMKAPGWSAIQENDDALRALSWGDANSARTALEQRWKNADGTTNHARVDAAIAAAQSSVGFGRPQAIAAAQQMATTGTGFEAEFDSDGNLVRTAMQDQVETIARAAGGNATTAAAIGGYNNFINKQKGRYDLAPGAGKLIELSHNQMAGGTQVPSADDYKDATRTGSRGADAVTIVRGKTPQVKALVSTIAEKYRRDGMPGSGQEYDQMVDLMGSLRYASADNQAVIKNAFKDFGIAAPEFDPSQEPGGPNARDDH